jgi:hypothetical protein
MTVSLSNVDQKIFDEEVKKAYQSAGFMLRDTVRMRSDVQGTTVDFRKIGSVTAEQYAFQSAVVYQDPGYNKATATLLPYRAPSLLDDLQQFLFNFDARKEQAELVGMACARRSDQLIIDALEASGTTNTIAAGAAGLTYAKVREVNKFFNDLAIPMEERHIIISATAEEQLLAVEQFTNSRYINLDAVKTGSLNGNFAMGMNWHVIPTMTEGGLPISTNDRTCFAYHKKAVGLAVGRDFSTLIERVAHLDSWQILAKIFAGAVAIDPVGIVSIVVDESVA